MSTSSYTRRRKRKSVVYETVLFSMFGALMFASDIATEVLMNVHFVGMFTVLFTAVYRVKALIPIYIYVLISGFFYGFSTWWLPYLYIWLPLWAMAMAVPKSAPKWVKCVFYPLIAFVHGLAFGLLYMPAQAVLFNLDFEGAVAWWISGLGADLLHGASNFAFGLLVYPLTLVLERLNKTVGRQTS